MIKKYLPAIAICSLVLALPIECVLTTSQANAFTLTFAQDSSVSPFTGGLPPVAPATTAIALRDAFQALSTPQKPFATIDFESGVTGPVAGVYTFANGTITVNPATVLTGGAPVNGISNDSGNQAYGFNTTGSAYGGAGNNLLRISGGVSNVVITIAFTNPVIDFGFFVTDYGNANVGNNIDVLLRNGGTTLFTANDSGTNPAPLDGNNLRIARFNQFTAASGDSRITSVQITAVGTGGTDRFGLDDFVYSVPFDFEPSLGIGLLGLGFGLNKFRKNLKAKKHTKV